MRVCSVPDCPELIPKGVSRCSTHRSQHERARGTKQQRGYDAAHDRTRAQWSTKVATGTVPCARCGVLIRPTDRWHLDHTDDRRSYLGPSHEFCNTSAGGRRAH